MNKKNIISTTNFGLTPDQFVVKFNSLTQQNYTLQPAIVKPGDVYNTYNQKLTENSYFVATILKDSGFIHEFIIMVNGKSHDKNANAILIPVILQTLNTNTSFTENVSMLTTLIQQASINKEQPTKQKILDTTYTVTISDITGVWIAISKD